MNGHLITLDGAAHDMRPASVRALVDAGTAFWLDLDGLDRETSDTVLTGVFGFHPLAVEDAEHFGQRPKVDPYDDFTLLVVYGTGDDGALIEVHCFIADSGRFLLTVHHDACPGLTELADALRRRNVPAGDLATVLHRVLDTLVDGFFPVLDAMDGEIDELEDDILRRPTDEQLGRLFDMKRSLIATRRVVGPMRDTFASVLNGRNPLPGMTPDGERYLRDLYDHLIRISELVDNYRDLLSGALDTHLSTVSNRLNVVMKQLTIIATVFLPLSFLTGFFGQNYGWMVSHLSSLPVFLALGIGLQVVTVAVLVILFKRRGWLSADGTVPAAVPAARRGPGRGARRGPGQGARPDKRRAAAAGW